MCTALRRRIVHNAAPPKRTTSGASAHGARLGTGAGPRFSVICGTKKFTLLGNESDEIEYAWLISTETVSKS